MDVKVFAAALDNVWDEVDKRFGNDVLYLK